MRDRRNSAAIAQSTKKIIPSRYGRGDRPHEKPPDKILKWFSNFHVWNFITAKATEGKPDWITVTQYPLNGETLYTRWKNSEELVGVRFSTTSLSKGGGRTFYLVIDIDVGSQYHPFNDREKFDGLLEALESIGLCRAILIRSSQSGGLHLYFPFPEPLPCYRLGVAVQECLNKAGYQVKSGQLEIFPNVRASNRSDYNAHRLPLQIGSYVLDTDFQPVHNSLKQLIDTWYQVASQQNYELLAEVVASTKLVKKGTGSGDVKEWKTRLETVLKTGWTSQGQTNGIIRDVCIYAIVFEGIDPESTSLESSVVETLIKLPGYEEYCGHQREIRRRVRDWIKTNRESKRYKPYGSLVKAKQEPKAPPNDVRSQQALERIKEAIATIISRDGALPETVKARQILICKTAGCSPITLRKHQELWHPNFQNQGCVTLHSEGVSAISQREFNDHNFAPTDSQVGQAIQLSFDFERLESQNLSSEGVSAIARADIEPVKDKKQSSPQTSECVTLSRASVSGYLDKNRQNQAIAERLDKSLVTHPSLLSVKPSYCPDQWIGRERQQVETGWDSEVRVNSIVQSKTDKAQFRITQVNGDGTYWAKWMNQPVPLVSIILKASEIELVKTSKTA